MTFDNDMERWAYRALSDALAPGKDPRGVTAAAAAFVAVVDAVGATRRTEAES